MMKQISNMGSTFYSSLDTVTCDINSLPVRRLLLLPYPAVLKSTSQHSVTEADTHAINFFYLHMSHLWA